MKIFHVHSIARRLAQIGSVILLLAILSGCLPPTGGSTTPTFGAQMPTDGSTWQAQRWQTYNKAFASITDINQLTQLDSNWKNVMPGGWVHTDSSGEAALQRTGCSTLYVYEDSGLLAGDNLRACTKEELGTTSCSSFELSGGSCHVAVQTIPGTVTWSGSFVNIIYNIDEQLLLVTVNEGEATITPNTNEIPDGCPASFTLRPGNFGYTFSKDHTANVNTLLPITDKKPCTALTFQDMQPLIGPLNLRSTLERMNENIYPRVPGLLLPIDPVNFTPGDIFARASGSLADPNIIEALAKGIDWNSNLRQTFQGQAPNLFLNAANTQYNFSTTAFDPLELRNLTTRSSSFESHPVIVLVPSGDPDLVGLANIIVAQLHQAKINARVEGTPAINLSQSYQKFASSNEPVFELSYTK